MKKSPCYQCPNRKEKCHATCEGYKNWCVGETAVKYQIKLENEYRSQVAENIGIIKRRYR